MRAIDADALLEALKNRADEVYEDKKKGATFPPTIWFAGMTCAADIVRVQPTIEPERKKGKWIKNAEEWQRIDPPYLCSECGNPSLRKENFCCSCGADMRGE